MSSLAWFFLPAPCTFYGCSCGCSSSSPTSPCTKHVSVI
jgi:hypothetical protein